MAEEELVSLIRGFPSVTAADLEAARRAQRELGGRFTSHLLVAGVLSEEELLRCMSAAYASEACPPAHYAALSVDAAALLDEGLVRRHRAIPLRILDGCLFVLSPAPLDDEALDQLAISATIPVRVVLWPELRHLEALHLFYGDPLPSWARNLSKVCAPRVGFDGDAPRLRGAVDDSANLPAAGAQFGKYVLIRRLAKGGMAEVYLAREDGEVPGFSRDIAIKRIFDNLAEDEEFLTMFFDEARIASNLNHPNIITIFELGRHEDSYYMAMEYVHGHDLRAIAKRLAQANSSMPVEIAVAICADAAAGLEYAHTKTNELGEPLRIVHRDVSPHNVIVGHDGQVKVCDFGIAKAQGRLTETAAGTFKGKFAYISPEQLLGFEVDCRSDVFCLAIVLYELTTGRPLFRSETDPETLRKLAEHEIQLPTHLNARYPFDLEALLLRALSRKPEDRPQSAGEFEAQLRAWLAQHHPTVESVDIARFMRGVFPDLVPPGTQRKRSNPSLDESVKVALSAIRQHTTPAVQWDGTDAGDSGAGLAFPDTPASGGFAISPNVAPDTQDGLSTSMFAGQSTLPEGTRWTSRSEALPDLSLTSSSDFGTSSLADLTATTDADPAPPTARIESPRPETIPDGLDEVTQGEMGLETARVAEVPMDTVAGPSTTPIQPTAVDGPPTAVVSGTPTATLDGQAFDSDTATLENTDLANARDAVLRELGLSSQTKRMGEGDARRLLRGEDIARQRAAIYSQMDHGSLQKLCKKRGVSAAGPTSLLVARLADADAQGGGETADATIPVEVPPELLASDE